MSLQPRDIAACPFRESLPFADGESACRLLAELSGVEELSLCRVPREACEACCRSFPPSAENLNPVVASLVYGMALRVADSGGVAGCDSLRADDLLRLAAQNLPAEEDCRTTVVDSLSPTPETPVERLQRLVPPLASGAVRAVRTWAVGVTTAPRGVPTLSDCLESLRLAGWDDARLFVDGEAPIPQAWAHLPQTRREPRVGAWPNYYLALAELYLRQPQADAYLLLQDDALLASGVREYLQGMLWPDKGPAIASLFCSRAYHQSQAGWHRFRGAWVWCALAFAFSAEAARRFLADLAVVQHRLSRRRKPLADIDWRIGRWALQHGIPLYYPTPSLVQHIGDVSALWPGVRLFGDRRASQFVGSPLRPE